MEFKHLEEVLNRYGDLVKTKYQSSAPEATGNLVQNVSFNVELNNGVYEVSLNLPFYWKYVEEGRSAGKMPPVERILDWVRAKPVMPREMNGSLPTEKQLAFLIARSIGENGIEGKHILGGVMEETEQQMLESVKQAFLEDIGYEVEQVLMLLY